MATLTKTILTIKTDKRLKAEAQEVAEQLGFPLGTVINAFLKQFVRDKSLSVSIEEIPSKRLARILDKAEKDFKAGKNMSPKFSTGKEAAAYLRAQR